MSDQTKIPYNVPSPTAGPIDPNAGARGKFYAALTVLFPLIGAMATFGVLSVDQANAITGFATAAMGLAGAFGFGLAAKNTNKQVKNGTFDPAPVLPAVPALEQLAILRDQAATEVDRAVANVQTGVDTITAAATSVLGSVPGVGPAVQELLDDVRLRS